jgi:hypothetical protein
MTADAIHRKWTLMKVKPGDYLMLSNDRRTMWRLVKYIDGPSNGLDWPSDRELWEVRRWEGDIEDHEGMGRSIEESDWEQWVGWGSGFPTRAEAIQDALIEEVLA